MEKDKNFKIAGEDPADVLEGSAIDVTNEVPLIDNIPDVEEPENEESPEVNIAGLSVEEIRDPNQIIVNVSDVSPIVVLFGARTSGKTMTLIRLTRYLTSIGCQVVPDRTFRPAYDTHYVRMCDNFNQLINSNTSADGNDVISFMLVKVLDHIGRPICQILEAPGEHYFDKSNPNRSFPTYINQICSYPNRKTWVFIVEQDWGDDQSDRNAYAMRIQNMQAQLQPTDKVIFTCHKVDKQPQLMLPNGKPNTHQFFKNIYNQYPGIFANYKNNNPITSFFRPYRFDFVTFSAGTFNDILNGGQIYTPGRDYYPESLWKSILKSVKG